MTLPKFNISQRGFLGLLTVALFLTIGAIAFYNGFRLPPIKTLTGDNLLAFWGPLSGVALALKGLYDYIDVKVADGSLTAGDIGGLFSMPVVYATLVAIASGIYQVFGGLAVSADTQVMIVDGLLLAVNLLVRSFSDRLPSDPLTIAQKQNLPGKVG